MDNLKIGGIIVISICLILLTINSFAERSFFTYNHKVGKHSTITRSSTELECEIAEGEWNKGENFNACSAECRYCLLYTSPSPRDQRGSRMPSSA